MPPPAAVHALHAAGRLPGAMVLSAGNRILRAPVELCLLAGGLAACLLAWLPPLGLTGFTYPKELVLLATAVAAASVTALRVQRLHLDRIDGLLLALVLWNGVCALDALNSWVAARRFSVLIAGAGIFWVARSLRERGWGPHLTVVVTLALGLIAGPALLETYGVLPDMSLGARSPSGTLGNRNSVAHALMLGVPCLFLYALRARRQARVATTALLLAGTAAALLLTRARTAWLAALTMTAVIGLILVKTPEGLRSTLRARRLAVLGLASFLGILVALVLPNRLAWKSADPYAESLRGMVDYESGSGLGRMVQYSTTLRILRDHPALGVGPGNWPVHYPRYASPGDPNVRSDGLTNPLHNGSWLGFAVESGVPGLLLLGLLGWSLSRLAWRLLRASRDPERQSEGFALILALSVIAVLGLLDSKLHTPEGGFMLFLVLGALTPRRRGIFVPLGPRTRACWPLLVAVLLLPGVIRMAREVSSAYVARTATPGDLARATEIYPGNHWAHLQLARAMERQGRCDLAVLHRRHARELYPTPLAPEPVACPDQPRQAARHPSR